MLSNGRAMEREALKGRGREGERMRRKEVRKGEWCSMGWEAGGMRVGGLVHDGFRTDVALCLVSVSCLCLCMRLASCVCVCVCVCVHDRGRRGTTLSSAMRLKSTSENRSTGTPSPLCQPAIRAIADHQDDPSHRRSESSADHIDALEPLLQVSKRPRVATATVP
eukprot:3471708-Rhodomonas_salina.1